MVNPLLYPPMLVKRALDDLSGIAGAVRRLEPAITSRLDTLTTQLDGLRDEMRPIQEITQVRAGIEPLDDDLDEVRKSIERIEPLVRELTARVERIDAQIAPLGELAEKVPGVGR